MTVAHETTAKQLVACVLGTEEYALPRQSVQEVIRFQQPRTVSSSDSSLLGVINLRGRIVPVHDVRPQLNIAGREVGEVREQIEEVASVAEQSSASTEQVSASTQQTSASAQEVSEAAQQVAQTAYNLAELASRFKLPAPAFAKSRNSDEDVQ